MKRAKSCRAIVRVEPLPHYGRGHAAERDEHTAGIVEGMARAGTPMSVIAMAAGVGRPSMEPGGRYREDWVRGYARGIGDLCATAHQAAMQGNVTMQIFQLKTRAGYREVTRGDGSPEMAHEGTETGAPDAMPRIQIEFVTPPKAAEATIDAEAEAVPVEPLDDGGGGGVTQ